MKLWNAIGAACLAMWGGQACLAAGVPGQGTWETTLALRDIDGNAANGAEAVYDSVLNITWLLSPSEQAYSWDEATAWAGQSHFGLNGWRLPNLVDTGVPGCDLDSDGRSDCGVGPRFQDGNAVHSEMAHLYFITLGHVIADELPPNGVLNNTGPFAALPVELWLSTDHAGDPSLAWMFSTRWAFQVTLPKNSPNTAFNVLLVRDGDVAAIPEPGTYALWLAGLAGLMVWRARRPA